MPASPTVRWLGRSSCSQVASTKHPLAHRFVVLVVAAQPDACLVAPLWSTIEPLVHAPEGVHAARIGGIGVVNNAVLMCERAHTGPLARVCSHVGSGHGG